MINEIPDTNITINTNTQISPLNIEDIPNNIKPNSPLGSREECPICFDNINDSDPILILDCCLKKVHLSCIMEWYSNRPENKTCFMCNQSNLFCRDLIIDEEITDTSSETTHVDNSTIIQLDNTNTRDNTTCYHIAFYLLSFVCLGFLLLCWGIISGFRHRR